MPSNTLSQTVNFLGFLRGQLQGLQGIPTLCYELIQNADDVKNEYDKPGGASRIMFDVRDDALWVENDGVFREKDFQRMQNISWGDKGQEEDTTGAFGIGFISVYQVTDSPEIFSSGQHWTFHPDADEQNRIVVEKTATEQTRFRLPWAFDNSPIRQQLQVPSLSRDHLENFTEEIAQAIEDAALFLRQINTLEVRRNGELRRRIDVLRHADQCLIANGETTVQWHIFRGDFGDSDEYHELHQKLGDVLKYRKTHVNLAVPAMPLETGLLYAYLPSETFTGLPFHINADFFPSPDRKRILLESDYKSDWNRLALSCACDTLADNVNDLLELFPDRRVFWQVMDLINQARQKGPLASKLPDFWEALKIPVSVRRTILTTQEKTLRPKDTLYPKEDMVAKSAEIFEDLGIPVVHQDLRRYQNLFTDTRVGVRFLELEHVLASLEKMGLSNPLPVSECPSTLHSRDAWVTFWRSLEVLLEKEADADSFTERLKKVAIAFGHDGDLYPPQMLFQEDDIYARNLFLKIASVVWLDDDVTDSRIPRQLVQRFDLSAGLQLLESAQEYIPQLLIDDPDLLEQIFDWFVKYEREIQGDSQFQDRIKALPLGPTVGGAYKPLSDLYLAGDFDDPLQLAELLNTSQFPSRKDFLRTALNMRVLDLETFVTEWIPRAWNDDKVQRVVRIQLVEFLSENLGKIQDDPKPKNTLKELPLVLCEDGKYYRACDAYWKSEEVERVLGKVPFADATLSQKETVRAFYTWLGLTAEPRPDDILGRIKTISHQPPDEQGVRAINNIFSFLAGKWKVWDEARCNRFSSLKSISWLPGTEAKGKWFLPKDVYATYQRYLFASQGNFLQLDTNVQQNSRELIRFLGVNTAPNPKQVVRHLLYCSKHNQPVNGEVYKYLGNCLDEVPDSVKESACLYITTDSSEARFYTANQVYLGEHPFGAYRIRLPESFLDYRKFLKFVGVKDSPDFRDALDVLEEIAQSRFAQANKSVNGAPEKDILLSAWEMLANALHEERISAKDIYTRLAEKKCIPDENFRLRSPNRVFFEDRVGWAEKFSLIKNDIVPHLDKVWRAMSAAGVRRLSDVVETAIADVVQAEDGPDIRRLLEEREVLFRRIVGDNHGQQQQKQFEDLKNLCFVPVRKITVLHTLRIFNRTEDSLSEDQIAYLSVDNNTIYFVVRQGKVRWTSIAREIAYALCQDFDCHDVVLGLEKILSGESFGDIERDLTDLGFPPLMIYHRNSVKSSTATLFGQNSAVTTDEFNQIPENAVVDDDNPASTPALGHQSWLAQHQNIKPPQNTRRNRTHLLSYVEPLISDEAMANDEPNTEHFTRRQEIGQRGVDFVMDHERKNGRIPQDMNEINPNNPGFDIKSVDPETREIRYIEVKALTHEWDGYNPARLTSNEFHTAQERGDRFWLYVVENVESNDPKLYCIQNPAGQIQYYCYDHGWIQVSSHLRA